MTRMKWFALAGCAVLSAGWCVTARAADCHHGRWGSGWRSAYRASPHTSDGYVVYETGTMEGEIDEPRSQSSYQPGGYTGGEDPAGHRDLRGLRVRPLTSTAVRLSSGGEIGRIDELVISDSGVVDYMIVSFTNLPGSAGRLAAIPWEAARFDRAGRVAILEMQRDELYDAPIFFSRGAFPNLYEGEWAGRVHSHFGLDSKRIERAYRTPDGERDGNRDPRDRSRDELRGEREGRDATREGRDATREGRDAKPAPAARDSKPAPAPERDAAPERDRRNAQPAPADRESKPAPAPAESKDSDSKAKQKDNDKVKQDSAKEQDEKNDPGKQDSGKDAEIKDRNAPK